MGSERQITSAKIVFLNIVFTDSMLRFPNFNVAPGRELDKISKENAVVDFLAL